MLSCSAASCACAAAGDKATPSNNDKASAPRPWADARLRGDEWNPMIERFTERTFLMIFLGSHRRA